MSRRWRRDSIFGEGPRLRLDREQRAQFRAKLHFNRRPGRLTIAAAQLGRVMLDMLGEDGRLDPSLETLAVRAGMAIATVKRALLRLKALGFLDWTRRLVRNAGTGWRCEQTSNAYALRMPACEAHFAPEVRLIRFKKEAQEKTQAVEPPTPAATATAETALEHLRAIAERRRCEIWPVIRGAARRA